ncbi:MAG: outer membrane protein assembly factor BamA [Calditrichaeota bacterium]|nr:outer membrane protein assembly factor BamA [Calditrichota bacterium]MCB9366370.1 outer membrane protein assembly factor BamA [Calditrichota bacterium]MCB9392000.1 outer membrane protein assembly factor BamA [Calditrichota bacterium]
MTKSVFHLLAVLFFAAALCAPTAQAQDRLRILGISIEGNESADVGLIRAHSGLSIGKEVSGDDVQSAIKQLWKLNLFSDIQIIEERSTAEGVYLKIQVQEFRRLDRVDIRGNRKLKGDDLDALLKLSPGQVVRPADVTRLRESMMAKYREMGYLLAEIQVEQDTLESSGRVRMDLEVREGKKVKVRRVEFDGNTAFNDKKLRKKVRTTKKTFFRSGEYKREKIEADKLALVAFYQSQGYRDAEVTGDSVAYTDDRRGIHLTFSVSEGPTYTYGEFSWAGERLFTEDELSKKLRVATGETYNRAEFERSMADIGSMYYDRGYIYASVNPVESVRDSHVVDVAFDVVEGNEFKVNRIFVTGNTKTKEKVIRREFTLYPGETFDVSKLRRSIREVTVLNYFASVVPDVVPISDDQVDLYVDVEEKSTDQANVSAGYSQRDKFIGTIGFQMNNLLGNGQQFALDWNFGRVYRSFSVSFTEPWFRNTRTLLGVSFFDTHRGGSYYGFDEDIVGGTLRIGRRLRWPDDYFRLDYIYRLDRTLYSDFTDDFRLSNPRNLAEDEPRVSSGITQIVSRDSRNEVEFPSLGSVNTLRTELTGGPLFGDDQFFKTEVASQWYSPLLGDLVMVSDTKLGTVELLSRNQRDIPYFDYFFMGGSGLSLGTSLRGYDERDVGPQSGGYPVGGKTMFKQSFELRYPIVRNPTIYILGFAEGGNVWSSYEDTNPGNLRKSIGFGARLFMPFIGMIGLDYGYGIDYYDERGIRSGKWLPHFQFGRTF